MGEVSQQLRILSTMSRATRLDSQSSPRYHSPHGENLGIHPDAQSGKLLQFAQGSSPARFREGIDGKLTTVRAKLRELRPQCKDGKLVEAKTGREYYFYHVPDWGTEPPKNVLESVGREYDELKRKYVLIEMSAEVRLP